MESNLPTPPVDEKRLWKKIWEMRAPPKVKNFLWRACRFALPTKQSLMRRKILEDPTCERCKNAVEDPLHALWLCPELDVVWSDQSMWRFQYEVGFVTVKELLLWMIDEGKSLELLAFTAWGVWNQRNKTRLMLQSSPLHQVAAHARSSLVQYRTNLQVSEVQVECSGRGENR